MVWLRSLNGKGYGRLMVCGKRTAIHRYVYAEFVGPIPDGVYVDHVCHSRACIRPSHLRLASPADNSRNRAGCLSANRLGIRGVRKVYNKYEIRVTRAGKTHARFVDTPEEARVAAAELREELFGEYAGKG